MNSLIKTTKEPDKKDLRKKINNQVAEFLNNGGKIESIDPGTSSFNSKNKLLKQKKALDN